jgi:hypothetical protein
MPIDISDEDLSEVGQTIQNIDFETLDRIQKMEFGKAKTASIVDPQTGKDVADKVKRQLSTLAGKIGRRLKYYNRKDFPQQIPEGRVGFEVISENINTPEAQAMLQQLNAWRANKAKTETPEVATNGTVEETPPVVAQDEPTAAAGNNRRPPR